MFLTNTRSGYSERSGEQYAHGYFLILMVRDFPFATPEYRENRDKVRGLVRYVRMSQFGHFMMARLTVKGHKLTLSGTYGADGLLLSVPQEVYDIGVDLPRELYDKWSKGGGHNSAGSEGPYIRKWALDAFKAQLKGRVG